MWMLGAVAEMDVLGFLNNPVLWKAMLGYWLFSAFVGALPMPDSNSGKLYKFCFAFMHTLSGNLNRAAVALRAPGAQ